MSMAYPPTKIAKKTTIGMSHSVGPIAGSKQLLGKEGEVW
jgi:hypothetical protein